MSDQKKEVDETTGSARCVWACNNHVAATHVEQPENEGTSDQPAQKVYHAIVIISSPVNEQQRLLDESNAGKVPLLDDSGATTLLTKSLYGL
eukprot:6757100-Prymnesium_polylepis.1